MKEYTFLVVEVCSSFGSSLKKPICIHYHHSEFIFSDDVICCLLWCCIYSMCLFDEQRYYYKGISTYKKNSVD